MPSTSPTIPYISTTNNNTHRKDKIYDATVVANYGDPGLTEDYFADMLSQYVICCIESSNRTLTSDKWKNLLVVVKRPSELWISYQNDTFINNPSTQSRVDFNLNTNTGPVAAYTVNTIAPINNPYQLGETIKIKLIEDKNDYSVSNQNILFESSCPVSIYSPSTMYYNSWHNQGGANPYIQANNDPPALTVKTISPISLNPTNNAAANNNLYLYNIMINKIQYEAFALNQYPQFNDVMVSLFEGESSYQYYYNGNGGYVFDNNFNLFITNCSFEDINISNKARIPNVNCLPLIVCSPQSFTVPSVRSPSTIAYSPTYLTQS